ncbi:Cytidylate kinase [compost metagenome]
MSRLIVAIDGPAGAGKSTVARKVANRLGLLFLDTGAMYRAITWKAMQQGLPLDDAEAITRLAQESRIALQPGQDGDRVRIDGQDVTDAIRSPEVTRNVSQVSAHAGVREVLVERQREMSKDGGVVAEGRDIGTVVFPNAPVKIFLVASPMERARRRAKDLEAKGHTVDLEELAAEIARRDAYDSNRAVSPLKPAADAVHVDTDTMTAEQVVDRILAIAQERQEA